MLKLFTIIAIAATVVGCADTRTLMLDSTHRAQTTSVDVFKDGAIPQKPVKEIAELSYKGHASDELAAQQYLIKRAEQLGGNAVLFTKADVGEHLSFGIMGGFGGATKDVDYLYKAKVLIYE